MSNLITAEALHSLVEAGAPVRLLDVRWHLDRPDGHGDYLAGHLPGAVFVGLDTELAAHGAASEGRHPVPSNDALQLAARRWGLRDGDVVVAYDNNGSVAAARAWWLLRRTGVDVRVLDGGLGAWTAAGFPVDTGEVTPPVGDVVLIPSTEGELSIDEAAALPEHGVLLDVRAAVRYRGESEPIDPIAGHIPGAINLPAAGNIAADGTLNGLAALREAFAGVGVEPGTPVAAYCGSGVNAAHTALALAEIGIPAQLFSGSWSAWSNTPGRPVAVGEAPDDERA
ncbi:MAG TPA: sulfurtransferase [Microbacteriaceae bacterium]|jgi:thiosulfate/3-mercaptopyruvate sulfurtransferase|nr:sulfurtransferase [Microbacteriaceae bacterium]HQX35848.1 sulfurtransferase [Microbacteriaceae bacterium]HQZ48539.1 sulfurtransferase [Microbacteriaceae bacterium]HRA08697.1 sulfurtransferase [Microbacteriaceae bacterium]